MMAKSLPSILPDLNLEEALEITKIHSISGLLEGDIPITNSSLVRWWENTKTTEK